MVITATVAWGSGSACLLILLLVPVAAVDARFHMAPVALVLPVFMAGLVHLSVTSPPDEIVSRVICAVLVWFSAEILRIVVAVSLGSGRPKSRSMPEAADSPVDFAATNDVLLIAALLTWLGPSDIANILLLLPFLGLALGRAPQRLLVACGFQEPTGDRRFMPMAPLLFLSLPATVLPTIPFTEVANMLGSLIA
jgi:prepilin signal peptidase PulO-like enzyme (type II secretory pathway)